MLVAPSCTVTVIEVTKFLNVILKNTILAGNYVAKKISNLFSRNSSNREGENKEDAQSCPVPTYVCPLNNGGDDDQQERTVKGQQHQQQARKNWGKTILDDNSV
jgi:hypothetical protein